MDAQMKLEREHQELLEKQKNVMYPTTSQADATSADPKNNKL